MISPKRTTTSIKNGIRSLISPGVPGSISGRYRHIDQKNMSLIEASLKQNYFTQSYLSSDEGKKDMHNHLYGRLAIFRSNVIPWLNDAKPLSQSRILEIGCGTGSSTVALAEQGADVTAIDMLEKDLVVAKDRCEAYNLNVKLIHMNATEVHKIFVGEHFDLIIFFACLEHMTHNERMITMKNTWDMLSPGDLWCVTDTPNRLWYHDGHTSLLPFYLWLPDDLAFSYSQFSQRKDFRDRYREIDEDSKLHFLRWGRGVSFHEFELTMKRAEELDVVSSLPIYLGSRGVFYKLLWMLRRGRDYESFLARVGPKIHRGFYQMSLDLIIRKD